jgi:hypothetical protein
MAREELVCTVDVDGESSRAYAAAADAELFSAIAAR